jgi:hypothetical protein
MTVIVCTGFAPAGYREYGINFLDTFNKFWPKSVELVVYTEQSIPMPRGACRSLWDCDGARDFHNRHNDDGRRRGTIPIPGWREKDKTVGYAWRFDAAKFYKQCLIPYDASKTLLQDDILVWLDADIITFAYVPENFIPGIMDGADLAFLGRGVYHSEIGFWAVRVGKQSRIMLQNLAEMYTMDKFIELPEHHSAFIFDHVRKRAEIEGMRVKNLTPHSRRGQYGNHIWLSSPLAKYTDHLKGERRKRLGHSLDHPVKWWERAL